MRYQLVPMDKSHLSAVAALERQCFSTPWTQAMLEEELYNPCASFIVAQGEDEQVLGYAGLHVAADEGYLDNIAVAEPFRRQGVGGALLETFLAFGRVNLAFLTLEVRVSNEQAIRFYRSHGFQQVGRRKDYYQYPKEDALLRTVRFQGEEAES
ncbi:MAG: ribosomal protein S18-alanine N-acetyltransferase [Oscillospiraceae bacterium]|nr:ribosomal protein S18-alanine N-acetyltransferase [Oscillospiraceae bacterium]